MRCAHCHTDQPATSGPCVVCGVPLAFPAAVTAATALAVATLAPTGLETRTLPPAGTLSPDAETGVPFLNPTAVRGSALGIGQVFASRYHILRVLGAGGMGIVYHAFDTVLGVAVALKVIRPEVLIDPTAAAEIERRFKRELLLARQITHKNVVRIHDLGDAEGVKYLTMPFIEGEDLATVLKRRGALPIPEVIAIGRQVADGLSAAHDVGVVHRDLKPENLMIAGDGSVSIMDFGISRSLSSTGTATAMGAVLGTLEYMAPEQGQGLAVDQRADVYACGLILYDMLTGRQRLARGDNPMTEMLSRMQQGPTPLRELDAAIPAPLEAIVSRALQAKPEARFQTSRDLGHALEGLTPDGHARAAPAVPAAARSRWMPLSVGAVVTAGALVLAGWSMWRGRAPVAAPSAPTRVSVVIADFQNQTGDPLLNGLVEQALGVGIEGAPFVSAYSRREAGKVAEQISNHEGAPLTAENAELVARREGIDRVVTGSMTGSGPYTLSVSLLSPDGSHLTDLSEQAPDKNHVLDAVGRAAARVRTALGDSAASTANPSETFTAASLQAAHDYVHAQELQQAAKYEEAIAAYKTAIAEDKDLGRAYAGLGAVSASLGRREDAETYYQAALHLTDRMTPREVFRTRGGYFLFQHNADQARDQFQRLVEKYPADSSGRSNLAYAYFLERDMKRAMETGRQASDMDPHNALRRNNAALYAMYSGDFAAARTLAQDALSLNAAFAKARLAVALSQLASGQPREAEASYRMLAGTGAKGDFSALGLADLALFEGRLTDAASIAAAGAAATQSASAAGRLLELEAEARAAGGDAAEATRLAKAAMARSHDPGLALLAGRVLATTAIAQAEPVAAALEKDFDAEPRLYGALLRGEIALARKDARGAVDAFSGARKLADTWLGRFGEGRAYALAGHAPEAASDFDWCRLHAGEATALLLDDLPTWRFMAALSRASAR